MASAYFVALPWNKLLLKSNISLFPFAAIISSSPSQKPSIETDQPVPNTSSKSTQRVHVVILLRIIHVTVLLFTLHPFLFVRVFSWGLEMSYISLTMSSLTNQKCLRQSPFSTEWKINRNSTEQIKADRALIFVSPSSSLTHITPSPKSNSL